MSTELVADLQQLCANVYVYAEAWTHRYKRWLQTTSSASWSFRCSALTSTVFSVMKSEAILHHSETIRSIQRVIKITFEATVYKPRGRRAPVGVDGRRALEDRVETDELDNALDGMIITKGFHDSEALNPKGATGRRSASTRNQRARRRARRHCD